MNLPHNLAALVNAPIAANPVQQAESSSTAGGAS